MQAAHAKDRSRPDSPAEHDAVVQTLKTMHVAATKDDLDLFHSVAAPDFYAFDNGHRFEGDALMRFVKQLHAKGMVYIWTVDDTSVHTVSDTAWITYTNRGSIKDPAGSVIAMKWLESAILQKANGRWLIRFFHSTRVPPPLK
jgi:ketosteroid isomerase-like protein